jgi:aromatic-L-amino-acid/L-tryptophan decarboxylase
MRSSVAVPDDRGRDGNSTMGPSDFRRHAHAFVDWMADYLETVERYPVRAQVKPGQIAEQLPMTPPEKGETIDSIFGDFTSIVLPGITHWQHPSFFAYFPANSSPPSLLAEMLTATLGAQCMLWQTSPAATEMETRVLDWLRQMIGLPDGFVGTIQDSASSATLAAILVGRERATGWRVNDEGPLGRLTVYCSSETHSSIEKGAKIAGIGRANVRKIAVDDAFAMRPDALDRAIAEDRAAGATPVCVIATLGTTALGAVDPVRPIADVCRRHDVYLHVDAAWAGSALLLPEHRWMIDGIELADSFVFNPHKWMLTNFDCSAHFVRDPDALVKTLEIVPAYLATKERGHVIDYRDWSVPLGRRFRALKLWFVIRSYGVDGLAAIIGRHIELARELEAWITAAPDFELLVPRSLALLNFRYRPQSVDDPKTLDRLNAQLVDALNDSGRLYLMPNRVGGAAGLRVSIGQTTTERRHVRAAWETIATTARTLDV